jgi:hypothetical protein
MRNVTLQNFQERFSVILGMRLSKSIPALST